jgi:hypothetical protein
LSINPGEISGFIEEILHYMKKFVEKLSKWKICSKLSDSFYFLVVLDFSLLKKKVAFLDVWSFWR